MRSESVNLLYANFHSPTGLSQQKPFELASGCEPAAQETQTMTLFALLIVHRTRHKDCVSFLFFSTAIGPVARTHILNLTKNSPRFI